MAEQTEPIAAAAGQEETARIAELTAVLNEAADAYYNGRETISDREYDRMYDELAALEAKTGTVLPDSPTQRAGFRVVDSLPKVTHEFPALSLDKTKDPSVFPALFAVRDGIAAVMWKMDGSTVIADYSGGRLVRAATRGNGFIGSDITHNAPFLQGLPAEIPFAGKLTVRGEAVMSYREFARINGALPPEEQFKNPRNLANASITLLSSRELSRRKICFRAFRLVYMDPDPEYPFHKSFLEDMAILKRLGIATVAYEAAAAAEPIEGLPMLADLMQAFSDRAADFEFPVDGLVVAANDAAYAEAQPGTAHNPNRLVGYALKWQDETAVTVLRRIEWQASRTGLLNPVAVFDPVELEGTTVTRASLHNVSFLVQLDLRPGDSITVFKANKIIPQIAENLSARGPVEIEPDSPAFFGLLGIPAVCPACGGPTAVVDQLGSGSYTAVCGNPECPAKLVGRFVNFCSRDCMNIIGLSDATIERFADCGFLREFGDFWKLDRFAEQITALEGYGARSFENLRRELETARHTTFCRFVTALGIPQVGRGQSKLLYDHFRAVLPAGTDAVEYFLNACRDPAFSFADIDGIGPVLDRTLHEWGAHALAEPDNEITRLLGLLDITDRLTVPPENSSRLPLAGKTFVITGDVHHFANRRALTEYIQSLGGKCTGSVTKNTAYLISNDPAPTGAKGNAARKLGVTILSEDAFLALASAPAEAPASPEAPEVPVPAPSPLTEAGGGQISFF